MPVQLLIIQSLMDIKQLTHKRTEPYEIGAFERCEVVDAAIIQLT